MVGVHRWRLGRPVLEAGRKSLLACLGRPQMKLPLLKGIAMDPVTAALNFGTALCNFLATPEGQGVVADIRGVNADLAHKLSDLLNHSHKTVAESDQPAK